MVAIKQSLNCWESMEQACKVWYHSAITAFRIVRKDSIFKNRVVSLFSNYTYQLFFETIDAHLSIKIVFSTYSYTLTWFNHLLV